MITNLHFDYCSLILLIFVIASLLLRRLNRGRTNKLFYTLTITLFIANITDIVSIIFEEFGNFTSSTLWVRWLVEYIYFFSRNLTGILYFLYVSSLLGVWHKIFQSIKSKLLVYLPISVLFATLFLNVFNKKIFYYDINLSYTRGPWIYILYLVNLYYVLSSIVILFRNRENIKFYKFVALLFFLPIEIFVAALELYFPTQRLDILATTIIVIIVAVGVQRPEEFLDYSTGVNSYNSFLNDMTRYAMTYTPIHIVLFKFHNPKSIRSSLGLKNFVGLNSNVAKKLVEMDRTLKTNAQIYYLANGAFALVASNVYKDRMDHLARMISSYAQEASSQMGNNISTEFQVCLVRCPEDINTYEALMSFVHNMEYRIPNGEKLFKLSKISGDKDFKLVNDIDEIIKRGINQNSFQMYYQPIYSVKKKRFVSAEALIRLTDVKHGFVSPGLFIPAAEKSGAIHKIGDFVLRDVCRFMSTPEYKDLEMEYVEINLSMAQCIERNLPKRMREIISSSNIAPEKINLELTETANIFHTDIADENINKLRKMGFTFALDDYGTGYSSIRRIAYLPLDIVKLDKSLTDDINNPDMLSVITNTIKMLHNINKKIVVEGIEDKKTADRYMELGCDYIQGYYFARPMPEEEFVKFIKAANAV